MKLVRPKSHSSFYESFSDLIFGTMAIFMFLVVVFMSQVNPAKSVPVDKFKALQSESTTTQSELAKAREELAKASEELTKTKATLSQTQSELQAAYKKHPIELVVAIDVSGSMNVPLERLKSAIIRLAVEIPKVTDEFRIGVVGYGGEGQYWTVPLTRIAPATRQSFIDSVNRLSLAQGDNDLPEAVTAAMGLFAPPSGDKVRKAFVLIGDVGPYERHGATKTGIYEINDLRMAFMVNSGQEVDVDKSYEPQVYEMVRKFTRENSLSSVMAMYCGNATRRGDDSYPVIALTRRSSVAFFRNVAQAGDHNGKVGNYSEDPQEMLSMLLLAMLSAN